MSCIITTDCNITEDSPGVLCPSRPYNGYGQAQRDEEVLQLWKNRSSRCKVLQTKKGEERGSEDYRECNEGFFPGQGVSTDLLTFINSKIRLSEESMKDFLDYFGIRKYEMNKGYSVEWVAKKIQ